MWILNFNKIQERRFITEDFCNAISQNQVAALPKILRVLKKNNVIESETRNLQFFFYTNTAGKAKLLSEELQKKEYSAEYKIAAHNKKQFVITGRTGEIALEQNTLAKWAKEMCALGFKCDCEFDGWGTEINQDNISNEVR
jgi:hypothetical protein